MRTIEQAVVSWFTVLTLLATTVSILASEQPFPRGSQAARRGPAGSTIGSATAAEVGLADWPGEEEYLSFVWSDARDLKKLPAADGHGARTCRVSVRGAAEYVADRQLKLAGGGFLVDSTSSAAFCDRCRRTGVLDVEFVLIPDEKQLAEPAVVMGAFRRNGAADLLLYQRADTLWLDVVMPPNADRPIRVELGKLRPGQPTHLLLCYVANMPNDKLVCYLDGKLTLSDDYDGGFSNWAADQVVFGQDLAGERSWRGRMLAVALGHRSYNATGAAERYEAVRRRFVSAPASTADESVIDTGAGGRVLRGAGTVSQPAEANRTVPGDLYVEPSTLHCLGFEWNIEGDDNRNGRVEVRYRRPGEDAWHRALDLLRLQRERIAVSNPEWAWQCGNMYAGSILFLDPGAVYEVRLTLLDPDHAGGDDSPQAAVVAEKWLRVATKTLAAIAPDGRRLHVYPEGFQGPRAEPAFADFAAAYREARPGDQILLHAGRYTFQAVLDKAGSRDRPIAIRAAGDGEVVLAGGGHTLDMSRTAYHWLEGLKHLIGMAATMLLVTVACAAAWAGSAVDDLLARLDSQKVAQCEAALRNELDVLVAGRVGPIVLTESRFTRKLPDGSVQVSQYWGRAPMQAYPFFDAYDLLGDKAYLRVALDLADYYLRVQEPEGFWHYAHLVKPDGTARRLELAEATGRAVCRIQDTHQTGCFRLMLYAWRVTGEAKYLAAAKRCGDYLLSIQNENGSWPDWWMPGHKHSDPNPRQKAGIISGGSYNDGATTGGLEMMLVMYQLTRDPKYVARVPRLGQWLFDTQLGEGRVRGWCQQYDLTNRPAAARHFETAVIDPRTFGRFVAPLCAWFYVMSGEERYMTLMQETADWIKSVEKPEGWAYQYLPDGTPCFSLEGKAYRHDQPETWPRAFPQKHDGIQKFTRDNGGPGDAPHFLKAWREGGRAALQAKFTGPVKLSLQEYERTRLSAARWLAGQEDLPRSSAQLLLKLRTAHGRFTPEQLASGAPPHFCGQGLHSFKVANWFDIPWR